jgi:hypothetical protein
VWSSVCAPVFVSVCCRGPVQLSVPPGDLWNHVVLCLVGGGQYSVPGFLHNRRQHRQCGLAAVDVAQVTGRLRVEELAWVVLCAFVWEGRGCGIMIATATTAAADSNTGTDTDTDPDTATVPAIAPPCSPAALHPALGRWLRDPGRRRRFLPPLPLERCVILCAVV